MRFFIHGVVVLTICFSMNLAAAQDKVVVIPLNSAKKLSNVVTVSAKGGDFTDPVAAVGSITDASASNPYLVLIGPGVYTLTQALVMKPFVSIAGSGQGTTILTGAISNGLDTSHLVSGADDTTLSDLTIENTGDGYSMALYNNSSSPFIRNVTATASGGTVNIAVYNNNVSPSMLSPSLTNVTAIAKGGAVTRGVENHFCSPTLTDVTVIAKNGTSNTGVYNETSSMIMTDVNVLASNSPSTMSDGTSSCGVDSDSSSLTMNNVTIHVQGGKSATGVRDGGGSLTMSNVNIFAFGFTDSYGVENSYSSLWIDHCRLNGGSDGILSYGTTRIVQSSILGGATNGSGTLTCITSDNGVDKALNASCAVIP